MINYSLTLVTPPTVEPITLAEAKEHCRIDPLMTEEDSLMSAAIVAARILAENQIHRQLITQTWLMALDAFPVAGLEIPFSPVQSVSVEYYDADGVQTLDPLTYEWDAFGVRPRFRSVYGAAWPTLAIRVQAVQLSIVAGYGDDATFVPKSIVQWIKCAVASMYEHRELAQEKGQLVMNPFLDGLLDPYRIIEI